MRVSASVCVPGQDRLRSTRGAIAAARSDDGRATFQHKSACAARDKTSGETCERLAESGRVRAATTRGGCEDRRRAGRAAGGRIGRRGSPGSGPTRPTGRAEASDTAWPKANGA